jgi:hypothetical protein
MKAISIILSIYRKLLEIDNQGVIPISLRHKQLIGTTQDDPFDNWVESTVVEVLGDEFEVFNTGKLQTPDLIIRHKSSGEIVCIEIKKLTENKHGKDPRGWTIDYNSSLPCGTTIIKVGNDSQIIPLYYLFALLTPSNDAITTLVIIDGDFLNYDFQLHKEAKTSNYMEYGHGPYGEGSIRHRKMYVYPNPLNSKLEFFAKRKIVVAKKSEFEKIEDLKFITEEILREDEHNNTFRFLLKDEHRKPYALPENQELPILRDVFLPLKQRKQKERTLSVPTIPKY